MLRLAGKPSSVALFENTDLGAPSITAWMAGSGAKRTLPLAASAISCALTLMPLSGSVRRAPIFSPGKVKAWTNDCTTFFSDMQARRVSGRTGQTYSRPASDSRMMALDQPDTAVFAPPGRTSRATT